MFIHYQTKHNHYSSGWHATHHGAEHTRNASKETLWKLIFYFNDMQNGNSTFENLNSITTLKYHIFRKKKSKLSQKETINFASKECGFSKGTWCKNGLFFHPSIETFISISTSFWQNNSSCSEDVPNSEWGLMSVWSHIAFLLWGE